MTGSAQGEVGSAETDQAPVSGPLRESGQLVHGWKARQLMFTDERQIILKVTVKRGSGHLFYY